MIIDKDDLWGIQVIVNDGGVYNIRCREIINEDPSLSEIIFWERDNLLSDSLSEELWKYITGKRNNNPDCIDNVQITKAEFTSLKKEVDEDWDEDEEDKPLARVVVHVAGGGVVSVTSDNPNIAVLIVDTDVQGIDDFGTKTVKTYNTDVDFDCRIYMFDVDNAIEFVDHFFSEYQRVEDEEVEKHYNDRRDY